MRVGYDNFSIALSQVDGRNNKRGQRRIVASIVDRINVGTPGKTKRSLQKKHPASQPHTKKTSQHKPHTPPRSKLLTQSSASSSPVHRPHHHHPLASRPF